MKTRKTKPPAELAAPSCSAGRWTVTFHCWDDAGNTQCCGCQWFEAQPSDREIDAVFEKVKAENISARRFALKVERQN